MTEYWDVPNLDAIFAEAAIAEYLHSLDPNTRWAGGNAPLIDVRGAGMTVDAKVAFRHHVPLVGSNGPVECVGFMGSGRETEVRPSVSHYGLVEVAPTVSVTRVEDRLVVHGEATVRIYLIPAEIINGRTSPRARQDGELGAGRNLYLPAASAENYEVKLPTGGR
ncbi:hypothetical protein OHB26_20715 [Nocardia sp. NBC_01503]|uniref:hypothetical protein n=1 Tax=Nocardia sp. NBC_01503 TaxID=2975997 RepID=UPI002E7B0E30|nr:hypothetical protein [Nocardia sp. NBC_01503]WTL29425.1 hypothetical protein OHB26_20715 [Nocardia sp. NBC_01503]